MARSNSISMAVTLRAKPAEVFRALTDARTIRRWSGQSGKVEAAIGGKFEMFDGWVKGRVLAYNEGSSLAYTWLPDDWTEGTAPSTVRFSFSRTKNGTKVVLRHAGFPDEQQKREHHEGWTEHVFDPLKKYFASHG
jgi:uncharacterized protein YndB with AHSA1/START domain